MKIFADEKIKKLFIKIILIMISFILSCKLISLLENDVKYKYYIFLYIIFCIFILKILYSYFKNSNNLIQDAIFDIREYINGNKNVRIPSNNEGEMYKLFHEINSLVSILNTHVEKEMQSKEFLKDTIFDISHQIKTPISALNIYNGIIQDEAINSSVISEFSYLSEIELDRIEILVKNLLIMAKFDTKTIIMNKQSENLFEIMQDINIYFEHRSKLEQKKLRIIGIKDIYLYCDRNWIIEGISNIVKNAFDHTNSGDEIIIQWEKIGFVIQITILDNGKGICEEDINYIFKRFYRSKYSKDIQGVGLGLPLAKAIITMNEGTIEVDSKVNIGTKFIINFLIPTKK